MKRELYKELLSPFRKPTREEEEWLQRQGKDPDFYGVQQKRLRVVASVAMGLVGGFILFLIFNSIIYPRVFHDYGSKFITVKAYVTDKREAQDGNFIVRLTTEPMGANGPRQGGFQRDEAISLASREEFLKINSGANFSLTYETTTTRYFMDAMMHRPAGTIYKLQGYEGPLSK